MTNLRIPKPPLNFWQGLRYSHDPRLVSFHIRQVKRAEHLLMGLTGSDRRTVRRAMFEVWRDERFLEALLGRHAAVTGRQPRGSDFMFLTGSEPRFPFRLMTEEAGSLYFHGMIQYALVRLLKPTVVVETGGTPGNSSAHFLRAMDRNQHGELHTVDLPPTAPLSDYSGHGGWLHEAMPEGQGSGWAVPEFLRGRHHQHIGDARELLPQVLDSVKPVDIFLHDSDHSYEHMMWEFETAWPFIRPGGVLLSDDIATNSAFAEFCAGHALTAYQAGGLGGVRKPAEA
ncbi:MAG TPA: class I SAM-dependent methyltransferase [Chloroflexi bacterium]|nr:class I SAM-dependent methyltransferase [Chloroflexota bacterium]